MCVCEAKEEFNKKNVCKLYIILTIYIFIKFLVISLLQQYEYN